LVCTHAERGAFSRHHLEIARRLMPLVSQALLNLRLERAIRERGRFFTLSLDLMCIITFDGHFKQLSHGWEDALGFTARELMARPLVELVPSHERAAVEARLVSLRVSGVPQSFESRLLCKDGSCRDVLWSAAGYAHEQLVYVTARDVGALKRVEDALREQTRELNETAERFKFAFESGVSGMALATPDGRYTSVNRALCEMTGYTEPELLARSFQAITHPDDLVAELHQYRALLEGAVETYETQKRYLHRDGHEVWVQMGVSAVREETGQVRYFISQTHDVTERRRIQDELAHRALHDPLTALPNRALFLDRLGHALARSRRHAGQLAVLFVDVDRFKLVNDGMGHQAGDAVLLEAARRLSEAARVEDTVARIGGDEFTILCENAGDEEARLIAERVLAGFARPFEHEGREFHLSTSVGIRVSDPASISADLLLRDADIALYAAKGNGRARYEAFDPGSVMAGIDLLATEEALRLALHRDELRLHYQPTVDLETERITGVEALVRWQHPERGLLPPGDFIPAAEISGLIIPIGEWVLREGCSQLQAWRRAGTVQRDVRVAVNVSTRQLSRPELPQTVAAALAHAELDPACLCLEITESALIQDAEVALANLHAIKRQGVFIALDDFARKAPVVCTDRSRPFRLRCGKLGSHRGLNGRFATVAKLAFCGAGWHLRRRLPEIRRRALDRRLRAARRI
jgi:diguanylate cyclase (GGDEF)-like protein/PAS domain S-box-containing protein